LLPVVARLDGRSFSKFTDGLERPYDRRLSELMVTTADYVARQTQACMAYTQSDEITLTWASFAYDEQML
ncbi:tRNA(His) guanylyltransferase Thg1 family protein, partial [Vibrio parahaemolyticus]